MNRLKRGIQPVAAVLLAAVLVGVPLWTVLVTAGKSQAEALSPDLSLPSDWQLWDNVAEVVSRSHVGAAFIGSLLLLVPSVALVLVLGSMASWVLARRSGRLAARIDGAGPLRVFLTIILPLLRPVLATATILISLYVWNDVFYAFFVVGGRVDTLPLNLFAVASAGVHLNNWHLIFTYVLLMSAPLVLLFTVFQRQIISGITSGAVK